MTESERCKEMLGNLTAPKSKAYRVSLVKNITRMDSPWEVRSFCVYGWYATVAFYDRASALDYLFNTADYLGLPNVAYHDKVVTFYRF